ncbi:hypothetical protein SELMODRAFT_121617, partial [Selaginella moellendorffii]
QFKLAVCQLSICADKEQNIRHAREAIQTAADGGSKLVLLPEMWNCPYSNTSFPIYAEDIDAGDSPSSNMLSDMAGYHHRWLLLERNGDHLYNTCCIYGKDGSLKGKHRKVCFYDASSTVFSQPSFTPGSIF